MGSNYIQLLWAYVVVLNHHLPCIYIVFLLCSVHSTHVSHREIKQKKLKRHCVVVAVISEKLAARMELEFKRIQRRKLFTADDSGPSSILNSPVSSGGTGTGHSSSSSNKDQPLFTLKQVLVWYIHISGYNLLPKNCVAETAIQS